MISMEPCTKSRHIAGANPSSPIAQVPRRSDVPPADEYTNEPTTAIDSASAPTAIGQAADMLVPPPGAKTAKTSKAEKERATERAFQEKQIERLWERHLAKNPRPQVIATCAISGTEIVNYDQLSRMTLFVKANVPVLIPALCRILREYTKLPPINGGKINESDINKQLSALNIGNPRKFTMQRLNQDLESSLKTLDDETALAEINRLMLQGADPLKIAGSSVYSPLDIAVTRCAFPRVEALLAYPYQAMGLSAQLTNSLVLAAEAAYRLPQFQMKYFDIIQLLLDHGADPNTLHSEGYSPIHAFAGTGFSLALARTINDPSKPADLSLLEKPSDPNAERAAPIHTLIQAASCQPAGSDLSQFKACFDLLTTHGSIDTKTSYGQTATIWAIVHYAHNTTVLQWCIDAGANLGSVSNDGYTALITACDTGRLDCVKLLVEHGQPIGGHEDWAVTPLAIAAQNGHSDVVAYLLEQALTTDIKAFVNAPGNSRISTTALHVAAYNGQLACVRKLCESGATLNNVGDYEITALISAVSCADENAAENIVEYLLANGADPMHTSPAFGTAASTAVLKGRLGILQKLYTANPACIDFVPSPTWMLSFPLILALARNHENVMQWLLQTKGASAKLEDGYTILHCATLLGVEYLEKLVPMIGDIAMKDMLSARNDSGLTPLHLADYCDNAPSFWWLHAWIAGLSDKEFAHSQLVDFSGRTPEGDAAQKLAATKAAANDTKISSEDITKKLLKSKTTIFQFMLKTIDTLLKSDTASSASDLETALRNFETLAVTHLDTAALAPSAVEHQIFINEICLNVLTRVNNAHNPHHLSLGMGHAYKDWHSPDVKDEDLVKRHSSNSVSAATRFNSHAGLPTLRARIAAANFCNKVGALNGPQSLGRFTCDYEIPGLDGEGIGSNGVWFSNTPYVRAVIERDYDKTSLITMYPVARLASDNPPKLNKLVWTGMGPKPQHF